MKKGISRGSIALLFIFLTACATGPGTADGNIGTAGLALQLKAPKTEAGYLTADGFQLTFHHFAVAFSRMALINRHLDQQVASDFAADFAEGEVADVVDLEDLPGVTYNGVFLTLGQATPPSEEDQEEGEEVPPEEQGDPAHEEEGGMPPELAGHSVFIEAEASDGNESCTVQVLLQGMGSTIDVDLEGSEVTVQADQETEVLVQVDPTLIFSNINLVGLCTGGNTVVFSETENSGMTAALIEPFTRAFSFFPPEEGAAEGGGESGGHSHTH